MLHIFTLVFLVKNCKSLKTFTSKFTYAAGAGAAGYDAGCARCLRNGEKYCSNGWFDHEATSGGTSKLGACCATLTTTDCA